MILISYVQCGIVEIFSTINYHDITVCRHIAFNNKSFGKMYLQDVVDKYLLEMDDVVCRDAAHALSWNKHGSMMGAPRGNLNDL